MFPKIHGFKWTHWTHYYEDPILPVQSCKKQISTNKNAQDISGYAHVYPGIIIDDDEQKEQDGELQEYPKEEPAEDVNISNLARNVSEY